MRHRALCLRCWRLRVPCCVDSRFPRRNGTRSCRRPCRLRRWACRRRTVGKGISKGGGSHRGLFWARAGSGRFGMLTDRPTDRQTDTQPSKNWGVVPGEQQSAEANLTHDATPPGCYPGCAPVVEALTLDLRLRHGTQADCTQRRLVALASWE